jgi:hypothetical protein
MSGVVPGNVIDFRFSGEDSKDIENLSNLFRDGSMLMFQRCRNYQEGMTFMRFVPGSLNFMRFDFTPSIMTDVHWYITTNPVEEMVTPPVGVRWTKSDVFFAKASDLFYNKATKTVFLNCEEDWYQLDLMNEKYFVLNNHLSITLHNLVTDEIKTLGEMRAWEVVDTDYDPFSSKWLGTPDLNVDYMDNFSGGETRLPLESGYGNMVEQNILDMINGKDDNSSDEEVESSEEEDEYAQDPNDVESSEEDDTEESDSDSDYDPAEDLEEGEVYEEDKIYEEDKVYEDQFDQEWLNNYYDEKRQDIDGNWYTRRQFYDYYGSDHAWDNLDPNTYQPYRYDEVDSEWYSKEEFFQLYGSDCVWEKMHPEMVVKRTMIWRTYNWAVTLPKHLRKGFIKRMLETY